MVCILSFSNKQKKGLSCEEQVKDDASVRMQLGQVKPQTYQRLDTEPTSCNHKGGCSLGCFLSRRVFVLPMVRASMPVEKLTTALTAHTCMCFLAATSSQSCFSSQNARSFVSSFRGRIADRTRSSRKSVVVSKIGSTCCRRTTC